MNQTIFALLTLILGLGTAQAADAKTFSPVTPVELRCDCAENPLGVDSSPPRLFWQLVGPERGLFQTAYQILVASSAKLLARDQGDLWDSGRKKSGETIHIPYAGKALTSSEQVFWKVRVWDQSRKVSSWSKPATWTMGVLSEADWHALALEKEYRCEVCGEIIPYEERELYFRTHRCAAHQEHPERDD